MGISFYELSIYKRPFKNLDDISHNEDYISLPNKYFSKEYKSLIDL